MQASPPPPPPPKPGHVPKGLGRDQPPTRTVSGKRLLAYSALGCVILFFIVWGSLLSVEHHVRDNRPELFWADRATWFAPAVIKTTLVKPNAVNAQYTYNKPRYRDPGFTLSAEEEAAVLMCAKLASSPDFTSGSTRRAMLEHARSQDNFYGHYLLATWYQLHDNTQDANTHYQQAIADAPKIIVIRYTDAQGNPVQNLPLDRIEIGCDRVVNDGQTLDQRLVLVYPDQKTDATGRVYLPVYDTTYRPVYLPQPAGYDVTYAPAEGWFTLPTRLGAIQARADTAPH